MFHFLSTMLFIPQTFDRIKFRGFHSWIKTCNNCYNKCDNCCPNHWDSTLDSSALKSSQKLFWLNSGPEYEPY